MRGSDFQNERRRANFEQSKDAKLMGPDLSGLPGCQRWFFTFFLARAFCLGIFLGGAMKTACILVILLGLVFGVTDVLNAEEWYQLSESSADGTDYDNYVQNPAPDIQDYSEDNQRVYEKTEQIGDLRNVTGAKAADSKHVTMFENNQQQWKQYKQDISLGGRRRMDQSLSNRPMQTEFGPDRDPNNRWYNYWHDTLAGLGGAQPDAPDYATKDKFPN